VGSLTTNVSTSVISINRYLKKESGFRIYKGIKPGKGL